MNSKIFDLVLHWTNLIQKTVITVAPKVWSVAVGVKQADCIGNLITTFICVLLDSLIVYLCWIFIKKISLYICKEWNKDELPRELVILPAILILGLGSIGFDLLSWIRYDIMWPGGLLDQWQWIGAFRPDLAVAHDIMQKALNN